MLAYIDALLTPCRTYRKDIVLWGIALLVTIFSYSIFYDRGVKAFKRQYTPKPIVAKTKPTLSSKIQDTKVTQVEPLKVLFSIDGLQAYEAEKFSHIQYTFKKLNYTIDTVLNLKKPVDRIQPNRMPLDLGDIYDVKQRKEIFILMMLPLALKINEDIMAKRTTLTSIVSHYKQNGALTQKQHVFIDRVSLEFGVNSSKKLNDKLDTLLLRIDTLPVSLILAQGAVESGWGTSRFAIAGNALFGQWTWEKDKGIIPLGRDEGKTHSIKKFSSPYQSMFAYVNNINYNGAYKQLRLLRKNLRANNTPVTGTALAQTLINYSQEREHYIQKLSSIIRVNKLEKFNSLTLRANPE